MSRPKSPPSYCIHSRSGQAYSTVDGRQVALGKADSPESRAAFDNLLGTWYANGRKLPTAPVPAPTGPTVSVVLEKFWTHAEAYYTTPLLDSDGKPRKNPDGTPKRQPARELDNYRQALRPLRRLYGDSPAADFDCAKLEAFRAAMILPRTDPDTGLTEAGWSRNYANRQMGRVKHLFKWAATKKLVPAAVHAELSLLPGLREGNSDARETEPVGPASEQAVLAVIPHVSKQVGDMIRLQLACGMRSSEICILRPCDIDRAVTPWIYRPATHKTKHRGKKREVPLGRGRPRRARPVPGPRPQSVLLLPRRGRGDPARGATRGEEDGGAAVPAAAGGGGRAEETGEGAEGKV